MTKEEYKSLLLDARWKDLSIIIKKRDKFECKKCGYNKRLQVHHKVYIKGRMPWEYDSNQLVTLCEECHKKEHKGKTSKDFLVQNKKQKKKVEKTSRVVPADYKPFQVKLEKPEEYYTKRIEEERKEKNRRLNKKKKKHTIQ